MSEKNILKVSSDNGETSVVPFAEVAKDGSLHTSFFKEFSAENPKVANVVIDFTGVQGVFDSLEGAEFALDRAEKTLGTYVTRVNKIVAGQDPNERQTRSGSASSSASKADVGIEMIDDFSVRLFTIDGSAEATVDVSGKVVVSDYQKLSYYIDAILNPHQWGNRISKLRQFTDGREATPPSYRLEYEGISVDFGEQMPDEQKLLKAKGELAAKLFTEGKLLNIAGLQDAEPEMAGGGEEWLAEWISDNYPDEPTE